MGKLHEHEIFLLNSDVLDDNRKSKVIQKLAVAGILQPKVLITTSVLDNGVSIHDEDVGNVVIATESELSFKQMLGRIRAEDSTTCNLYIYPRTQEYYQKRVEQYTEKMRMFDEIEQKIKQRKAFQILCSAFYGSTERKDFLHNALVFSNEVVTIFEKNIPAVYISYGNLKLNINKFAKEKTGNLMLMEKCFLKLSLKNTVLVAHKQISWIGKASNELKIIPSTYFEEQKNQLVDKLRRVKNLSLKEFSGLKCEVAEKYQKTLFPDIPFNGGSFSNDKFMEVCNRYGLEVSTEKGVDNKNVYSINVVSSDA